MTSGGSHSSATVVATSCGRLYTLPLDEPHRPTATHARCAASQWQHLRHRSHPSLQVLHFHSHTFFLFSLQRSSARTHSIQRTVHRCGALGIELLQRQVALVLHYSSLLEICDLYRNQHGSLIKRSAPSLPEPMYSPNYLRMRSRIL